jgi:competence protein ComEC
MPAVIVLLFLLASALAFPVLPAGAQTLDIYFIDTEGGQATLYVSPSGESLLVDTGNPGPRDHGRIMEAIHAAGLQRIDHLWITHYHSDHHGGLEALAQAIPIRNFYDHGPSADAGRPNVDAFMEWYAALAGENRRGVRPGERIPIAGVDVTVVASHTALLETPIAGAAGAGQPNPLCADHVQREMPRLTEDDHSAGFVLTYGAFRTINLGDLSWNLEHDLVCPRNPIGTVSLYLTSYHGADRAGSPALVHALRPRVAVVNNGSTKGGAVEALRTLYLSPGLKDVWQLHWSHAAGTEYNAPGIFVANLDAPEVLASAIDPSSTSPDGLERGPQGRPRVAADEAHSPAHWIKVSAQPDGTFTVTNSRNGFSKTYEPVR